MKEITRRNMLLGSGIAGATLAAGLGPVAAAAQSDANPATFKLVVAGGHPGDPEYGCGGTIARYSDLGHKVVLLYLNEGDPIDTTGPRRVRVGEAAQACEILKARPSFAGQIDGRAVVDLEHYDQFTRLLETEKPDVVLTHWTIDNHADHRAISFLVYEAWLRLRKSFALYYYEVSNGEDTVQFNPTHYVDISGTEPRKRAACYAHASQAPEKFYGLQEAVSRFRGFERGCKHAEAFVRHVQSPDLKLPLLT